MYLKHYWVDDNGNYLTSENKSPRCHPSIVGLDVKYWLSDFNGVDYCLSQVPNDTTIDEVDGLEVLTQSEWDAIVSTISTPEDIEWKRAREKRDELLSKSDWTQQRDVILDNDSDWKVYRQQLRDIPQNYEKVIDIVWPTKPQ